MRRWELLASMACRAKVNGEKHQEIVFANYLEQAYRLGISDAAATRLEDMKMIGVECSREYLETLFPPKRMRRKQT